MPFIKEEELEWLFKHSFYPTFIDEKNGKKTYHFGSLPARKSLGKAIQDARKSEQKERSNA